MNNLIYLGIAIVLSVVGSLILWMRHRQPRSMEAGIEQFAKGLQALAPEQSSDQASRSPRTIGPSRPTDEHWVYRQRRESGSG
jgi:hypothetical protein